MGDYNDEGNIENTNPYITCYNRFSPYLNIGISEDDANRVSIANIIHYRYRNIEGYEKYILIVNCIVDFKE